MNKIARLSFIIFAIVCTLVFFSTFSIKESFAQVRPAMVRNVDEPARVPYSHSLELTCPLLNSCNASFPAVPAGKRLRLMSISGVVLQQTMTSAFVALHRGNPGDNSNILVAFPESPFNMAYFGQSFSFNHAVDFYFEAGEFPGIEMGTPPGQSIVQATWNRFNVSGYLVDLVP